MLISPVYYVVRMSGPGQPLSLIIGPSEVIVLYWAMLPGFFVQVVF